MYNFSVKIIQGTTTLEFAPKSMEQKCDLRKAVNIGLRNIEKAVNLMKRKQEEHKERTGKRWANCPLKMNKPVRFVIERDGAVLCDSHTLATRVDFTARPQTIDNLRFNLYAAVDIEECLATPDLSGEE